MFVTVIHKIHDPEGFEKAEEKALEAGFPPTSRCRSTPRTNDHTLGICIWEGESVDAVREVVEGAVGPWQERVHEMYRRRTHARRSAEPTAERRVAAAARAAVAYRAPRSRTCHAIGATRGRDRGARRGFDQLAEAQTSYHCALPPW